MFISISTCFYLHLNLLLKVIKCVVSLLYFAFTINLMLICRAQIFYVSSELNLIKRTSATVSLSGVYVFSSNIYFFTFQLPSSTSERRFHSLIESMLLDARTTRGGYPLIFHYTPRASLRSPRLEGGYRGCRLYSRTLRLRRRSRAVSGGRLLRRRLAVKPYADSRWLCAIILQPRGEP